MNTVREFQPHKTFRNAHLMTIAAAFWRREYLALTPSEARLFDVEPGAKVRGECHWQENRRACPTLVLLHGLEGSTESGYMLGTAEKACIAGFNVVRLNQRNCGGTESLTETLYHSGMSSDIRAVVMELIEQEGLPEIFAAGFSMGGNLVLKMAGELGDAAPAAVRGFVAIAPAFELAACANALAERRNVVYQTHFVRRLKKRMQRKAELFPHHYGTDQVGEAMRRVRSVRDFDETITARFCGFTGADDYYERSSARQFVGAIRKPTLILTAQDDPFVPFETFEHEALTKNSFITLVAPRHGGHCAFISDRPGPERFWAEARIVEFCAERSEILRATA